MRLLKLAIYPLSYLRVFYARQPDLEKKSYAVQHKKLIGDCFGSSDFWTNALIECGFETLDIIANAENLQRTWATENDFNFDEKNLFGIAAAQIKKFRPDILLVADYSMIDAAFLKNIRRECDSIRLILGWCGAPYADLSVMREWDIALSCVPEMVAEFRAQGIESFHVNHAFEPRILEKLDLQKSPDEDFIFIGSIVKKQKFHLEREKLLLELIKKTDLQIFSDIKPPPQQADFISNQTAALVKLSEKAGLPPKILRKIPFARRFSSEFDENIDRRIASRVYPPLFGVEMFQTLHDARIVFNNHIDISPVSASNMRLFEATGAGSCLITDWKNNLPELFEPDAEVVTYKSAGECADKVKYLLEHETERRKIAAAGQLRTLRDHNFADRAARINEIIRKAVK